MDEDSRLDQFLAETGTKFRISDLFLQFDGVLINGTDWISQLQSKSDEFTFRYRQWRLFVNISNIQ